MKTKLNSILLASLVLFLTFDRSYSAGEKKDYPPTAASDALEAACKQAAKESKAIFVKSGFPECGWCRVFDRYHSAPEVQQIIGKYYVVVAIDTKYMPDGEAVFSKYAKPGAPSWVIITSKRNVIVDSYAPEANVGYPLEPNETAHYVAALKKATPKITDQELEILSQQIKKAAGK
jgi:thioredoxin-related protein